MTWGEALAGFLASGAFAALANRSFDAFARWRAESVLERLHDDCREEVRAASARIDSLAEENASIRVDLARCEERHTSVEERIARLERRSNPPATALEPAE